MTSNEGQKQHARSLTRRERMRKTIEEEEERLRSENLGIKNISLNDNEDFFAQMEQI